MPGAGLYEKLPGACVGGGADVPVPVGGGDVVPLGGGPDVPVVVGGCVVPLGGGGSVGVPGAASSIQTLPPNLM